MNLETFIQQVAEQYDETPLEVFNAETEYKTFDEWNSLLALSIIAMIDDEYGIIISNTDLRQAKTIKDLYQIVSSK